VTVAVSAGSVICGWTVAVICVELTTVRFVIAIFSVPAVIYREVGVQLFGLFVGMNPVPVIVMFVATPTVHVAGCTDVGVSVGVTPNAHGVILMEYGPLTYPDRKQVKFRPSHSVGAPPSTDTPNEVSVGLKYTGGETVTYGSSCSTGPPGTYSL